MRYPVNQRIVIPGHIPFGGTDPNGKYGRHSGDDSANGCGTPVYAPANGTVTGYSGGGAQGITVEIFDGQFYPHIFHLQSRVVNAGQRVSEGQLIGYVGTTGLSTGCHIHFGVSKKSVPQTTGFSDFIDPLEYIKGGGDMPLTASQKDKAWKMAKHDEPTADELNSPAYNDGGVLIETAWNSYGEKRYAKRVTRADIDNLLKDIGITPAQADYDALGLPPRDFAYYLQNRIKKALETGDAKVLSPGTYKVN